MRNSCLKCMGIPMRKSLPMIINVKSTGRQRLFHGIVFLAMGTVSFVAYNIGRIGIVSLPE